MTLIQIIAALSNVFEKLIEETSVGLVERAALNKVVGKRVSIGVGHLPLIYRLHECAPGLTPGVGFRFVRGCWHLCFSKALQLSEAPLRNS